MQLDRILSLLSLAKPAMGGVLARRALVPLLALVVLSVLAGMLAAIVLGIGLLALDHWLVAAGLSPMGSLASTALAAVALLLLTLLVMRRVVRHTRDAMRPRLMSDIVQSFVDGFTTPKP